jgi:raffinose/stachyose/melibiose transport system substrate-binding protein
MISSGTGAWGLWDSVPAGTGARDRHEDVPQMRRSFRMQIAGIRRSAAVAAAALLVVTGLSSCGSSRSSSSSVLTVWDYESADSAMGVAWAQAVKDFEKSHPGVTVKTELKTFDQIQKGGSMLLNSSDAPDVLEYNKGDATAGLLSKEGLLTDLSPEVQKYGWDKKITGNVAVTSRYSNGIMGSGDWYGIPDYAEYAMVYYNKSMFQQYDVAVPTTFSQFVAAMQTFVSHGVTPLASAGNDYPAQQYLYDLALMKADPSWVSAYQTGGKASFTDAAWTYAASTFQQWVSKGYIAKNSVSSSSTDMGTAFEQGKSPMMVSGSWWYGTLESEVKSFSWGSFLWPGAQHVPGSGGNIWVVPAKAHNKQSAYDFIDTTLQPDIQNLIANKGAVPVAADPAQVTDPMAKTLIAQYQSLVTSDGLAFYPDWPVPGFYNTLISQTQNLMNGSSPTQVLGALQTAYQQGLSQ